MRAGCKTLQIRLIGPRWPSFMSTSWYGFYTKVTWSWLSISKQLNTRLDCYPGPKRLGHRTSVPPMVQPLLNRRKIRILGRKHIQWISLAWHPTWWATASSTPTFPGPWQAFGIVPPGAWTQSVQQWCANVVRPTIPGCRCHHSAVAAAWGHFHQGAFVSPIASNMWMSFASLLQSFEGKLQDVFCWLKPCQQKSTLKRLWM